MITLIAIGDDNHGPTIVRKIPANLFAHIYRFLGSMTAASPRRKTTPELA